MIALKNIARASRVLSFSKQLLRPAFLIQTPLYSFSFMQLFEANKPKGELDPAFKRITKLKGHVKSSSRKVYSKKLNRKARVQKQRLKNHKGLLKRIKIVNILSLRWVLAGIASSSFNPQARNIFCATNQDPT